MRCYIVTKRCRACSRPQLKIMPRCRNRVEKHPVTFCSCRRVTNNDEQSPLIERSFLVFVNVTIRSDVLFNFQSAILPTKTNLQLYNFHTQFNLKSIRTSVFNPSRTFFCYLSIAIQLLTN